MRDVMLDLETMGNTNNAVIVQIGACYFDRQTGEIGSKYSVNIDIDLSLKAGFSVTGSTIYWWLNQDREAQKSFQTELNYPIIAINGLNNFLNSKVKIWSHATFDFVILMNYFEKLMIKPVFHYRSAKDIRTIVDISGFNFKQDLPESVGTPHNALDDCVFQVAYVVECFKRLRKDKP